MRACIVLLVLAFAALACNLGSPDVTAVPTLNLTSIAAPTSNGTLDLTTTPGTNFSGGVNGTPINGAVSGTTVPGATTTAGNCTPRSDWPTTTVVQGDTLSGIAMRTGASIDDLVAANCLASADAITAGQTLHVPVAPVMPTSGGVSYIPSNCGSANWFFSFLRTPDASCPGALTTTSAVGQNFQGGRVYRYAADPGSNTPTIIYVIFNDGTWQAFPDTWDASQPNDDPSIVPDPTWYKPYGAIGKIWREQPGLRQKLGWAYQPESPFTGRLQLVQGTGDYFYLDHGLRNLVLRVYGTTSNPGRWEVAGAY